MSCVLDSQPSHVRLRPDVGNPLAEKALICSVRLNP